MKLFIYILLISVCLSKTSKVSFIRSQGNETPGVYKDTIVTGFFKRTTGCIAGDGGYSVPLTNNRVMWLMGDSHIDDYNATTATVPCLFQVRNTALLQPLNDWNNKHTSTLTGTVEGLKSFLKNQPNDSFFIWPGAGIVLKNTLYVYCNSLKNSGTGAFGFAAGGNDLMAQINLQGLKTKVYNLLPDFEGINFGVGFIKDAQSKWVYAYGQKYIPSKMECDLYVARFTIDNPLSGWQFWDGSTWKSMVRNATIIARQTGVSGTFHISRINNKILLLSSQLSINCDSGTEIYSATAHNFYGPFTERKMIYAIEERLEGHSPFFYAVIAHPEYINNKNELLVTYAINGYGTCVPDCNSNRMDPEVYRLQAIRVPCSIFN
ncbi:MAG: hypothetical protein JWP81_5375 [Ferruginibacter sp.]|nr:hypothetical protein [Ferruginibacter sp.]